MLASVTMNAGMPTYATQKPCQAPISAPSARQRTTASEPGDVVLGHHDRADRADEGGHRPDGQVDVAGHDDDHHADGQDQDLGVLDDQVGDVERLEQHAVGRDLEQHARSPPGR